MLGPVGSNPLTVRAVRLDYPDGFDPGWHRELPELACLANAVSLLMPHLEPTLVRSVQAAVPMLDGPLAAQARDFVRQEAAHHGQHRRFNGLVRRRYRAVRAWGWLASASFAPLRPVLPTRLGTGYAAGAEAAAFAMARWIDPRLDELFAGADPHAARLFLWHLAEEAEHKGVAWEVHRARGGGRLSLCAGMAGALAQIGLLTFLATVLLLAGERRLHSPRSWLRLCGWLRTFTVEAGGVVALTLGRHHHPDGLRDPEHLLAWVRANEHDLAA